MTVRLSMLVLFFSQYSQDIASVRIREAAGVRLFYGIVFLSSCLSLGNAIEMYVTGNQSVTERPVDRFGRLSPPPPWLT